MGVLVLTKKAKGQKGVGGDKEENPGRKQRSTV